MDVSGVSALVTGAASGMGLATAAALKAAGARVGLMDVNHARLQSVAHDLSLAYAAADISDRASLRAGIETIEDHIGPMRILVNCAGVIGMEPLISEDADAAFAQMQRTIAINLTGALNVSSLFAGCIAKDGVGEERGVIILVASGAAFDGVPGSCAYSAAKGGVVSLTLAMARELGPQGIRVNTISPGPI
ncbi:MAG: SDR family NAD(P)-dependent oxidoreductase, partial [Pseudomonadota bacterium]